MLKVAVALILLFHGLGQIMPFLAAWTRVPVGFAGAAIVTPGARRITDVVGKTCGILAILALTAFMIGTYLFWIDARGCLGWLMVGAAASLSASLPWWKTWPAGSRLGNLGVNVIVVALWVLMG